MKEALIKRFRSRVLLNHSTIVDIEQHIQGLSTLEEFHDFYEQCVLADDPLDVPFINRNMLISRNIWQSNYQRLHTASTSKTFQS